MTAQPLHLARLQLIINLHPAQSGNITTGVQQFLNGLLLSWSDDLDGVALCYTNERIVSSQAPLHAFFSYLQVTVQATFLLFRPEDGQTLSGRVSKVGQDFLALLVLGVFNVAIGASDIRDDLQHHSQDSSWHSLSTPGHSIKEGDVVRFTVQRSSHDAGIFSLQGALLDSTTGSVSFLALQEAPQPRKAKRRRSSAAAAANPAPNTAEPPTSTPLIPSTMQPAAVTAGRAAQTPGKPQKQKHRPGQSASAGQTPGSSVQAAAEQQAEQAPKQPPKRVQPGHSPAADANGPPQKKRKKHRSSSAAALQEAPEAALPPVEQLQNPGQAVLLPAAGSQQAQHKPAKRKKREAASEEQRPQQSAAHGVTPGLQLAAPASEQSPGHKPLKQQLQAAPPGSPQGPVPALRANDHGGDAQQSPPHRKQKRRKHSAENGAVLAEPNVSSDARAEPGGAVSGQVKKHKQKHKKRQGLEHMS